MVCILGITNARQRSTYRASTVTHSFMRRLLTPPQSTRERPVLSAGSPVVSRFGRKAAAGQPLGFEKVKRILAARVMDKAGLGHHLEAEEDVVVPVTGKVQLDEFAAHDRAVGNPFV